MSPPYWTPYFAGFRPLFFGNFFMHLFSGFLSNLQSDMLCGVKAKVRYKPFPFSDEIRTSGRKETLVITLDGLKNTVDMVVTRP